ncbi:MAG: hypothetical protein JNK30_06970 [Phenylobacterium sp.]|uniref:hypothetical protein n=1 Tax=Phenylobacterium sp. TaxID=1871053 RepID=UPI001A3C6580|nr:hypothetical protein [Phenylobacterium sp.]MBL8771110.1 hypothetical protein [Phenylobacterium sp.]
MKTPKAGRVGAIGLAMALMATLMVPAYGVSQGKKDADIPKAAREQGAKEAPAVLQAAGLPCQVSDARKIGEDKKNKVNYYEVACGAGQMGYVLQAPAAGAPTAFSCIEANTPPAPGQAPSAPCILPGNQNPKALLQPLMKTAGVECLPESARGIGQTKSNTYMEVACQGGAGYILLASVPFDGAKPLQAQNCLLYDESESNIKCTLSDKTARMAVIDKVAAAANNGCAVKDRRFVGIAKDGSTFYEASCNDGKGYIYKTAVGGNLVETYECAKATQILGGCTLTDARQAQSEQAGLYTRLVSNAGGKCEVEKYALFPTRNPREEVVELVCKDGKGAILMSTAGQKSTVVDCGRAPIAGYKCSMGSDNGFASLTSDLKRLQQGTTCEVSNSRVVGKTDKGTTYVEVACADKLKGYMIEYSSTPAINAVNVVGCAFAGNCKLPGNT